MLLSGLYDAVADIFALIDCNSFYCSCELVFKPHLKGKPIVVLSNNDGCAIARTPEAKALGIKMGTPEFMIRENKAMKDVVMFSSNYTLYGDFSHRVQEVVREFVPNVEIYSIDELFLNLKGLEHNDLIEYSRKLREAVLQWVGIPTGIGIGPTKTLAKIANFMAKHHEASRGVFSLMDHEVRKEVLDHFPIEELWGIGKASRAKLNEMGIEYAGQLRDMPIKQARQYGTVVAERMINELRGISCIPLEELPPARKGTAVTRSFGRVVTDYDEITQAVSSYCARGAEKLRSHELVAGKLTVFMHTNPHRNTQQYYNKASATLSPMTSDTRAIINEAMKLCQRVYKSGIEYGKAGIFLDDLRPVDEKPLDMFATDKPNSEKLMSVLDGLNQRFGKNTLQFAGMGMDKAWKLRCERKSPCYTTRIEDVAKVRAD